MLLRKIRKEYNLTQVELGKILQVSPVQVSRIEKGTTELSLAQFGMLCKALKLTNEDQQDLINRAISQAKPKRIRKSKDQD